MLEVERLLRAAGCPKINLQIRGANEAVIEGVETGLPAEHENPDGKPLTSSTEYRELVVMALDEEIAQARDAYFREKTRAQTVSLKDRLQDDLDDAAKAHGAVPARAEGKIVIE